jgi:hypothetical protein
MAFNTRQYCLDNKIPSFSLGITHDGTKKVPEPVKWGEITTDNFHTYHNNKNGFAIICGLNNYFVIDCDEGKANGAFPQDIIDTLSACCKAVVKTPNGRHFYFKGEGKPATGTYWKGEQVAWLDVLAGKKFALAPPSHYSKGDDVVQYKWLIGDLTTVVDLPDEIREFLTPPVIEPVHSKLGQTSLEDIRKILGGLAPTRFSNYDDWLKIGIILKNEGFDWELWDEFSKQGSGYKPTECWKKWRTFTEKDGKATIASLYRYLKIDNPNLFEEMRSNKDLLYKLCAEVNHDTTAFLFYSINPNKYIYSPHAGWYELKPNNIYSLCDRDPATWKRTVKDALEPVLNEAIVYYSDQFKDAEEGSNGKKIFAMWMKDCRRHLSSIKTAGYMSGVLSFLQEYCYDESIYKKMDANIDLLAFNNCLYDYKTSVFRPIEPSDYVSVYIDRVAPDIDTPEHPALTKFFWGIFENDEKRQFLLDATAYSLWGNNKFQKFFALEGDGGNGKGVYASLQYRAFGDYTMSLPTAYITDKIEVKGKPLPEMIQMKPKRLAIVSEPKKGVEVDDSFIKTISGEDPITARALHKPSITYQVQTTLWILTNGLLLRNPGPEIMRRLMFILFPFLFQTVEFFNPDNERSRLADPELGNLLKTEEVVQSFIALILRTYRDRIRNATHLEIPPIILKETKTYLYGQIPITEWFFKNYRTDGDKVKDKISNKEMCDAYSLETGNKISVKDMPKYLTVLGVSSSIVHSAVFYKGLVRQSAIT